ncbi:unnamed protein product [Rotaria socialis]|uniref:Glycosyltransferase family 28 N-terminal domain-containing protein n=2 Tax=Rotaria socialis TaxID=392032 RepID=A0A818X719_9BILA|nr:unnamed protein product [Rotaria socialis]CAF4141766.1 unnamed protein product [Rotaria socialis]CAF4822551.1 unnamed protein product [Rotaria socialis]
MTMASNSSSSSSSRHVPRLNIVMQFVGTRGDIQPLIAYGQMLQNFGHRVRFATHNEHRALVTNNDLKFFPLGGDSQKLMKYMVTCGGIYPTIGAVLNGAIGENNEAISEILKSTWASCIDPDEVTNDGFFADAIIANPPSFGHIHCAEKLRIPLHIVFTMPWSETINFSHPLARSAYRVEESPRRRAESYQSVERFMWTGSHRIVNDFRKNILGLLPLSSEQALRMMNDVPHTYCWSPSLVPKPNDWGPNIDVCGFFFLYDKTDYPVPRSLMDFLDSGDPPLYIGFGSISGHDERKLFRTIIRALNITGKRAVVSDKLIAPDTEVPENIHPCGNCPHDWLFQYVSGVCHHGGAGTTATGLRAGLPTIIVPFFGDQYFWSDIVEKAGAGPPALSARSLHTRHLVDAINFISDANVKARAQEISRKMRDEHGCEAAMRSFHQQLPLDAMQSDLEETYPACYRIPKYGLKVSWPVAQILLGVESVFLDDLLPCATCEWNPAKSFNLSIPPLYRTPDRVLPYTEDQRKKIIAAFSDVINKVPQK